MPPSNVWHLSWRPRRPPEMALRLGKFCGNGRPPRARRLPGAGLWLRMQQGYDLWQANQKLADELRLIPAHRAPQLAT